MNVIINQARDRDELINSSVITAISELIRRVSSGGPLSGPLASYKKNMDAYRGATTGGTSVSLSLASEYAQHPPHHRHRHSIDRRRE